MEDWKTTVAVHRNGVDLITTTPAGEVFLRTLDWGQVASMAYSHGLKLTAELGHALVDRFVDEPAVAPER